MKKRTYLRRMLFLLMAMSISFAGIAQNPDFSGEWKLNESESKMGGEFSFAPLEISIEQEGNKMTTTRVNEFQGERRERTSAYMLDGTDSKNEGFQGSEIISVATWTEKELKIVTEIEMQNGGELTITAVYSMKGEKLVISNAMEGGPMGGGDPETWVYDKQ
jgi:hypothetical protein